MNIYIVSYNKYDDYAYPTMREAITAAIKYNNKRNPKKGKFVNHVQIFKAFLGKPIDKELICNLVNNNFAYRFCMKPVNFEQDHVTNDDELKQYLKDIKKAEKQSLGNL